MRMTADDVTARVEIPDMVTGEKSTSLDICGRDEEMPAPAETLERIGDLHRALAAVVKGQRGGDDGTVGDRVEMRVELRRRELVAGGVVPCKSARVLTALGDDIVVHQHGRLHQQMPR